ncbi:MAG: hypothetical protein Q4D61_05070 [Cardiobacteriaceae bacterium]|nr:hypothetical protein [Cardiobacteriaceae bacterium]
MIFTARHLTALKNRFASSGVLPRVVGVALLAGEMLLFALFFLPLLPLVVAGSALALWRARKASAMPSGKRRPVIIEHPRS